MAVAPIGTPVFVGWASGPRSSPLTITSLVDVPAGATIIVSADADSTPEFASGVTDTAGNGYTELDDGQGGQDPYIALWAAWNAAELAVSGTITVTFPGSASNTVTAIAVMIPSGLASGNPFDQITGGRTTGRSLVLSTGKLAYNGEAGIGYWSANNLSGPPQIPSNWNSLGSFQGQNSTHWVNMAWIPLTKASAVTAHATTTSGQGMAGIIATLMPSVVPTAELDCGGTMASFPVSPVPGTAYLGCGGSMPGPAELAPYAPPQQPVFPAGYGPLPADFGHWVQQSLGYATAGTVFRAEQHTSQSLSASAYTPLTFDTVTEDPFGGWSTTATSAQAADSWLVPWDGVYRITFGYLCTSGSSHWNDPAVGVSGVNPAWEAGGLGGSAAILSTAGGGEASVLLPLIAGDYVQALAWCSSATSTDVSTPGRYASMEITATQVSLAAAVN